MSTYNVEFYEDLTKIIFQLSSNMHLISSSERTYTKCVLCRDTMASNCTFKCNRRSESIVLVLSPVLILQFLFNFV